MNTVCDSHRSPLRPYLLIAGTRDITLPWRWGSPTRAFIYLDLWHLLGVGGVPVEAISNRWGEVDLRARAILRGVRRGPAVIHASADRDARIHSAATPSLRAAESIGDELRTCNRFKVLFRAQQTIFLSG